MLKNFNKLFINFDLFLNQRCFQHAANKAFKDTAKSSTEIVSNNNNHLINQKNENEMEKKSFARMFKESKFVALGDMENKYLIGKIVDIVGDDLYIDYGGKFNCVCKRPIRNKK